MDKPHYTNINTLHINLSIQQKLNIKGPPWLKLTCEPQIFCFLTLLAFNTQRIKDSSKFFSVF